MPKTGFKPGYHYKYSRARAGIRQTKAYRSKRKNRKYDVVTIKRPAFPRMLKTKVKYTQQATLNPGVSGIIAVQKFRVNGLYDVDFTGSGHQPRYFDQLMTIYDHYSVIGCKVKITATNRDDNYAQILVASFTDDTTGRSNWYDYAEQAESRLIQLSAQNGSSSTKSFVMKCNVPKLIGLSPKDDAAKGSVGANPDEDLILQIAAQPNQTIDSSTIDLVCEFEFAVNFTEPKYVAES